MPRVSVVIPTWNGVELLAGALASLARQVFRDFEVLVVDNGSNDGTSELLVRNHPDVRRIRFEENRGFAVAVNAGIRAALGEIIVLMNNDTEADPAWLDALVAALDSHPEVGSCASKVLDFYDPTRIDSAGDQLGVFASPIGHGEPDGPEFAHPRYVLSACAGAAAYRRRVFDDIGLFDERYFAYFEDVDWGVRARFAGYRCLYVPDAVIYHRVSETARRVPSTAFYLRMRNSLFLFFQYMPLRRLLVWTPVVLVWPLVRAVSDRQPFRLAFRSVFDFLRQITAVVRVRRRIRGVRRVTWDDFRASLASPLARARRVARPVRPGNSPVAPTAVEPSGRSPSSVREALEGQPVRVEAVRPELPVAVVVVNWNGRRYLPECLRALGYSVVPLRTILVDNASRDDSVAYVRRAHPEVEILTLSNNVGYAAAANAGLRRTASDYALVMNPDVILAPDYVARLKGRLEEDPSIGAAQGKLYEVTREKFSADSVRPGGKLDSAGHVIRRSRAVVDRGQGREDSPEFSREVSVFSASGAALVLRRAMLEDLAPQGEYFDESFFAYKEDIDLCWRARLLGWDIRYIPAAVGYHVRAWSGQGLPPKKQVPVIARRHSWKNHYLLMLKNDRLSDMLRALPAIGGWECVRHAYALFRDPALYRAYVDLAGLLPAAFRRRQQTLGRRRVAAAEMRRWFGGRPSPVGVSGVPPTSVPVTRGV